MGVAINGVAIFNQYAAGRVALTSEVNSFDEYNGHPQNTGQYHYHVEPTYITGNKGKDALIGFLLDGYPVYGTSENGKTLTSADLDTYHGHTGVTADYPRGVSFTLDDFEGFKGILKTKLCDAIVLGFWLQAELFPL